MKLCKACLQFRVEMDYVSIGDVIQLVRPTECEDDEHETQ